MVTPLGDNSGFGALGVHQGGVESAHSRFEAVLDRARSGDEAASARTARQAAEEFVGLTLVQPILTMLREQSTAAPPFAPGPGEKVFGPLLDAEIAKRITQAKGFGLIEVVARNLLEKRGAVGAQEVAPHAR